MSARLNVNDTIIHRKHGRAKIRDLSPDGERVTIRAFGGKPATRRVWARDCEKLPKPWHLRFGR